MDSRLFLALVPDADVVRAVAAHRDQWHWHGQESLYQPEDWHVTLHFIGNVTLARRETLRAAVTQPFVPFELHFGQAECWPRGLAVFCPTTVPSALIDLHHRLGQALQGIGQSIESRRFRPHLTLARRAERAQPPTQPTTLVWKVAGYTLMESTGATSPLRYRSVQEYQP